MGWDLSLGLGLRRW